MVAITFDKRLSAKLLPILSIVAGMAVAALVAGAPADLLAAVVARSGLTAILPAATPPIGVTGRTLLALLFGLGIGSLGFVVPLAGRFAARRIRSDTHAVPVVRRADAHPDAPARRPIRASEDLGPPLPMVRTAPSARVAVERALPADLDIPMAAFDPRAVPAVPREPVRAVAPLARPAVIDPGERFATFEPAPATRDIARAAPAAPQSIAALLDRLERSRPRRELGGLRRSAAG